MLKSNQDTLYTDTSSDASTIDQTSAPLPSGMTIAPVQIANDIASSKNLLELTVNWNDSARELHAILENTSDWGPFELMTATQNGNDSNQYICRFHYHGETSARQHFEANLKELISAYASIENAPIA